MSDLRQGSAPKPELFKAIKEVPCSPPLFTTGSLFIIDFIFQYLLSNGLSVTAAALQKECELFSGMENRDAGSKTFLGVRNSSTAEKRLDLLLRVCFSNIYF